MGSCFEAHEVVVEEFGQPLPFVCDEVRVGTGGEYLKVLLINNDEPLTFKNIADGERLPISIVAVLDTDCDNIVILK